MKNRVSDLSGLKMTMLYFIGAAVCIVAAQLFGIVFPEVLLKEPLTGKLILWTHLHTMGVISPIFFGMFFYNLRNRYGLEIKYSAMTVHFVFSYVSLVFFLYFISSREGSLELTLSALLLFISGLYFVFLCAGALYRYGRKQKEKRDLEFWIDAASLYFLLQALLFGFVLAANLSHHFLRRSELHSLRLHSHSGITGFWLMQTINFFYRSAMVSYPQNAQWNKYVKFSAASIGLGLFLWTSVHDRFSWFFYVYYTFAGASLLFLSLYTFKIRLNVPGLKQIFLFILAFMASAFLIASILVFYSSEEFIYGNHLPFIYIYIIIYAIFALMPVPFLLSDQHFSLHTKEQFWNRTKLSWIIFYLLIALFVYAVIIENLLAFRIFLGISLVNYLYLFTNHLWLANRSNH